MKQRSFKPRFTEWYFARLGRKYFYRTIGQHRLEFIEEPYESWGNSSPLLTLGKSNIDTLEENGWQKYSLEAFKQKFHKLPIYLDNEQKVRQTREKKIKDYLIQKQRIMNGSRRYLR